VYRVHNRDLAAVDTRYRTEGGPPEQGVDGDYGRFLSARGAAAGTFPFVNLALPSHRTEYYTASRDVSWYQLRVADEVNWSIRSYRPGRQRADWNSAPLGPAFGDPSQHWGVQRSGNQLSVAVTLLSGSDRAQFITPGNETTGTTTLSRDGAVLGTSSSVPGVGTFPIPDTAGTYTLHATATRSAPWTTIGTRSDVIWTFHEPGATAPVKPLPLLVVRATGNMDDQGRAPAGTVIPLALTVQAQPGARLWAWPS
jgi:hypothetical protein